jgi:hypothetical protein
MPPTTPGRCPRCGAPEAGALLKRVVEARLMPVILDLHNLAETGSGRTFTVVLGFAGTREFVDQEIDRARQLGVDHPLEANPQERFWSDPAPAGMVSVLPSRTVEILDGLGEATWLAHAGNGVIHHRGGEVPPGPVLPWALLGKWLVPLPESDVSCGGAGSYFLTQPGMAARLQDRKIANVLRAGAGTVVTTNPGCLLQIRAGLERHKNTAVRVEHLADFLWDNIRTRRKPATPIRLPTSRRTPHRFHHLGVEPLERRDERFSARWFCAAQVARLTRVGHQVI